MSTAIRLLTLEDLDGYIEHIEAHATESGRDGDPVFMPYGKDKPFVAAPSRELREKSWAVAVGEPGWNRCWGFFDGENLVGHAELSGSAIDSAMHRVRLGMGLMRPYRRQGHGRRLIVTLIDWARGQGFIDWIDLGVFAGNKAGQALYESTGFVVVTTTVDSFRVDGASIDDIEMTLPLSDHLSDLPSDRPSAQEA